MHVLHLIDGLGLGGAERMLVDTANASAKDGHRVSVCVTRDNVSLALDLAPGIELVVLRRRRRFALRPLLRLAAFIRAHNVDVLHVHMRSSLLLALLMRTTKLIRIPIVFHDHYGTIETDTAVPAWFRIGGHYIDQYVGVHQRLTDWAIKAGVPAARAHTIENRLDLDRLRKASTTDLDVGFDGLVGALVATVRRPKGIEIAITALALCSSAKHIRVLVIGTEPDPTYASECRELVQRLGLQDRVVFVGARTDVPEILRSVDFGLLSSHTESGPLVLIEYLAAGLPIVSTRVGDIGRKLDELGVEGFVAANDSTELSKAIDQLVELPADARRERASFGQQILTSQWDIQNVMHRWYRIYETAMRTT